MDTQVSDVKDGQLKPKDNAMIQMPASRAAELGLNECNPFARPSRRKPDAADLFLLEAEHSSVVLGRVEIEVTQTIITTVRVRVAA